MNTQPPGVGWRNWSKASAPSSDAAALVVRALTNQEKASGGDLRSLGLVRLAEKATLPLGGGGQLIARE